MDRPEEFLGWHLYCIDPTLLLPEEALESWHAAGDWEDALDSYEGTHYGLVCEALESSGGRSCFVHFDGFVGFVPAKWNPLAFVRRDDPAELLILETFDWDEGISAASVLQVFEQVPAENWESLGDFVVGARGAVMAFHAGAYGQDWNDSSEVGIRISLLPGAYEIRFASLGNASSLTYWKRKQGEV